MELRLRKDDTTVYFSHKLLRDLSKTFTSKQNFKEHLLKCCNDVFDPENSTHCKKLKRVVDGIWKETHR